jgi:hypothetical protein
LDPTSRDKKWYTDSRIWGLIGCGFVIVFVIVLILVLVNSAGLPPAAVNQNNPPPWQGQLFWIARSRPIQIATRGVLPSSLFLIDI